MDNEAIIRASAANRIVFADLLETLTPEQLSTQSLCGAWDVETVGAHLSAAITTKLGAFAITLIRCRGNFDKANDVTAKHAAEHGISTTIDLIRDNANSRFAPPGSGLRAPLTDVLVHTGDIARPLGLEHHAPDTHVRTALEFLTGGRAIGFVKPGSLKGIRLVADDLGTDYGDGQETRGRGVDLMMAVCGRTQALDDLTGDGVEKLRTRWGS